MSKIETDKAKPAAPAGERKLTASEVVDYLAEHRDFLSRRPELLSELLPPSRFGRSTVVDFQQAMVQNLQGRLHEQEERHQDLIATSRANLSVQNRVHEAVLTLLSARTFEHLIEIVTTDLAIQMDVDVVTVCVEGERDRLPSAVGSVVHVLAPGTVDRLLGPGRNVFLQRRMTDEATMFGPAARLVASAAFLRLTVSPATPPGLLCLGSRLEDKFHNGQGTELLIFLARVIEYSINAWLDLPPK
ncbi:MAG: DUF484 family protein [Alphaproteobacteria bacterium]|nr:DUF484 family protein [Alphaproteobacteria bacterium]